MSSYMTALKHVDLVVQPSPLDLLLKVIHESSSDVRAPAVPLTMCADVNLLAIVGRGHWEALYWREQV